MAQMKLMQNSSEVSLLVQLLDHLCQAFLHIHKILLIQVSTDEKNVGCVVDYNQSIFRL